MWPHNDIEQIYVHILLSPRAISHHRGAVATVNIVFKNSIEIKNAIIKRNDSTGEFEFELPYKFSENDLMTVHDSRYYRELSQYCIDEMKKRAELINFDLEKGVITSSNAK